MDKGQVIDIAVVLSVAIAAFSAFQVCAALFAVDPQSAAPEDRWRATVSRRFLAFFAGLETILGRRDISPRDIGTYVAASAAVGIFAWFSFDSLAMGLVAFIGMISIPRITEEFMLQKQRADFEANLAAGLDLLASSIRSGLNLLAAFREVAERGPSGVKHEFARIVSEYEHGASIETALEDAGRRIRSKNFDLLVLALNVNREKGGNLVEAVSTMSSSFKEVWRLEEKIQIATAEGRKAAKVITIMPLGILLMVLFLQPSLIDAVTSSLTGALMLIAAAVLYVVGLWWLMRILDVDV